MLRIEIKSESSIHTIERTEFEPVQALDDLINLLYMSKYDITEIQKAVIEFAESIKKDHKNEAGKVQRTCSI